MRRLLAALLPLALAAAVLVPAPGSARAAAWQPPALRVAVVYSDVSQDWSDYSGRGYGITWRGQETYDHLKARGWNVTLRHDDVFSSVAELQKYDVVVLPYVFCLDPGPSANLQAYVAQGGGVVSMLASPRVAPAYDKGPQEQVTEHWFKILGTNAMEWGPMSEVYQTNFVVDPSAPPYKTLPWPGSTHPILSSARQILAASGYASSDLTLDRSFSGATMGGVEFVDFLKGNANAKPVLSFVSADPSLSGYPKIRYAGGYPAAVASEYLNGRSVYFYFSPEDFLSNLFSNLAGHRNASGVPQSAVASALIDSAIVWAATDDGVPGRIVRSGKTSGELKVYQDGIYAFQYVRVDGNVSLSGQAYFRVYDPAGRLVYSKRHPATYVGTYPGGSLRFAYQYVPGALMSGKYRVEVEYVYGYPKMDRRYKEVAYVVRGQGTGIKTQPALPSATAVSKVTNAYFAPQPITPNNDGWADWGYATFSTDQPAMVTVKVYDLNWKLLAVPQPDKVLAPGRYSVRFAGAGSAGALPNGAYYYSIQTYNDKGKSSSGGVLYIHRTLGKAPALGTKPVLGDTIASPSPFSASTAIKFNLSATAWTSVKVFGPSGAEVRTLVNNARIGTGDLSVRWDGRDSSGALCPNGTYRYYVFTSGGGSAPYTRFKDGTVRISR